MGGVSISFGGSYLEVKNFFWWVHFLLGCSFSFGGGGGIPSFGVVFFFEGCPYLWGWSFIVGSGPFPGV